MFSVSMNSASPMMLTDAVPVDDNEELLDISFIDHDRDHDQANNDPEQQSDHAQLMDIDETSNRVFIRDLEDEIQTIQAEEQQQQQPRTPTPFLHPMFEKPWSPVSTPPLYYGLSSPRPGPSPAPRNQLVLSQPPRSLGVSEEHDIVRAAILDSRQRALARFRADHQSAEGRPDYPSSQSQFQSHYQSQSQSQSSARSPAAASNNGSGYVHPSCQIPSYTYTSYPTEQENAMELDD